MEMRLYMKENPYFLWQTEPIKALPKFAESDCALVKNGSACAYIVAEPDAVSQNAAAEFSDAIEKMTGCRLPLQSFENGIPVYLGAAAFKAAPGLKKIKGEFFSLFVSRNAVFAAGNDAEPFYGLRLVWSGKIVAGVSRQRHGNTSCGKFCKQAAF